MAVVAPLVPGGKRNGEKKTKRTVVVVVVVAVLDGGSIPTGFSGRKRRTV